MILGVSYTILGALLVGVPDDTGLIFEGPSQPLARGRAPPCAVGTGAGVGACAYKAENRAAAADVMVPRGLDPGEGSGPYY